MRGPGYKLSGDVRRTWRCSICGRERKLQGEITSLLCECRDGTWMQIVAERTMVPRPLQRPSDIERHPIDFGIEPPPPALAKPEATIVKSAVDREPELPPSKVELEPPNEPSQEVNNDEDHNDDWGEGIL